MSPTLRFDGRVAIVTGSSSGLGRSHASELAARGATVVHVDCTPSASGGGAGEAGAGDCSIEWTGDLTAVDAGAEIVAATMDRFGRVDVVVNNAGIIRDAPFAEATSSDLDELLSVHVRAAFRLVQAAWPHMCAHGYGRVVNTISNAALFGKAGMSSYAAAKGALLGWTHALALEGEPLGIAVNAVAPIANTAMTAGILADLQQTLAPKYVSAVVAWLAHESCPERGATYSAAGGNVSRIVVGRVPLGTSPLLTAEHVAELVQLPTDLAAVQLPSSAADEVRHLRADLGAPADTHVREASTTDSPQPTHRPNRSPA